MYVPTPRPSISEDWSRTEGIPVYPRTTQNKVTNYIEATYPTGWIEDRRNIESIEICIMPIGQAEGDGDVVLGYDPITPEEILSASWHSEKDTMEISDPIQEFEFTMLNIDGRFDEDNPDNKLLNYGLSVGWYVCAVAYVSTSSLTNYQIPLGVFRISDFQYDKDNLRIICHDLREIYAEDYSDIIFKESTTLAGITKAESSTESKAISRISELLVQTFSLPSSYVNIDTTSIEESVTKSNTVVYQNNVDMSIKEQMDYLFATRLCEYHMDVHRSLGLIFSYQGGIPIKCASVFQYAFDDELEDFPSRATASNPLFGQLTVNYIKEDGSNADKTYKIWMRNGVVDPRYYTMNVDIKSSDPSLTDTTNTRESWADCLAYRVMLSGGSMPRLYQCNLINTPEISIGNEIVVKGRYGWIIGIVISHDLVYEGGCTRSEVVIKSLNEICRNTWGEYKTWYTWKQVDQSLDASATVSHWIDVIRGTYAPYQDLSAHAESIVSESNISIM